MKRHSMLERWGPGFTGPASLVAAVGIFGSLAGCSPSGGRDSGSPRMPNPPDSGMRGTPGSAFADASSTTRFLTQSTFGPTRADIQRLTGLSASAWFRDQLEQAPSLLLPKVDRYLSQVDSEELSQYTFGSTTFAFWSNVIHGDDQLRQRMGFALSQLFVVSNAVGDELTENPFAVAYLEDVLIQNAFGNFRDLLEAVTYAPAMAYYLTYLGNQKADPLTGRVPDENYAREILQLFSIGVIDLNPDGTPRLGGAGELIETYSNQDVTELAKVFTGLDVPDGDPQILESWRAPMVTFENKHSTGEKRFLGSSIPAGTQVRASITQALDIIFAHPNVPPFISRQIIQRFVTSDPSPAYVARVASTFDAGRYTLPDGTSVGTGLRGDLGATLAAVLFDEEARTATARSDVRFGKIREPILRLTHWARAFGADGSAAEYLDALWNLDGEGWGLSQHPYQAPSVFNFYRPGYVAPGTRTGAAGLTVPELQIINATSVPGDANFMEAMVFRTAEDIDTELIGQEFPEFGVTPNLDTARRTFVPDYSAELTLAGDSRALLDHLDAYLCFGSMTPTTKQAIYQILEALDGGSDLRVRVAVWMVMTSSDYMVQR